MKFNVLMIITFFSISAIAQPVLTDIRVDVRKMTKDGHRPGHSYKAARKMIMQKVHLRSDREGYFVRDVYCNKKHRKKVGPAQMPSHQIINIEHTWPRSRFGHRKGTSAYRVREADLHHLFPTDSRTNSTRGNHYFNEFGDRAIIANCSACKKGIISKTGEYGFEPPNSHKGNVARSLFYFSVRYDIEIPEHEEFYLKMWHIFDPVDAEELKRNDAIASLQGNRNPFIDDESLVDLIQDF